MKSKLQLLVINTMVFIGILVAIEGIAWLMVRFVIKKKVPFYEKIAYYQRQTWAKDYFNEHQKSFQLDFYPFVISRKKSFKGNYVNIDTLGLRKTAYNSPLPTKPKKIFFMGGSTIFGTGSPDSLTIPSYFMKHLRQQNADTAVIAYNFGESAWVIQQSFLQLVSELRKGNVPDYVVFYDGANDMYAALQNQRADSFQNAQLVAQNFRHDYNALFQKIWKLLQDKSHVITLMQYFFPKPRFPRLSAHQEQLLAQDVVQNYFGTYRLIDALAQAYHFQYSMYWQPVLATTQKKRGVYEQELLDKEDSVLVHFLQTTTQAITAEVSPKYIHFYPLQHSLDTIPEDVFFDFVHISPQGNDAVARKILEGMQAQKQP